MTELQRVHALAFSNTIGGDGIDASYLILEVNAIIDVGRNRNPVRYSLQLVEEGDVIPPTIDTASINYGTGLIVITTDETMDVTPYTTKVDLAKIRINHFRLNNECQVCPENGGKYSKRRRSKCSCNYR